MEHRLEYGMIGEGLSDDLSQLIHEKMASMISPASAPAAFSETEGPWQVSELTSLIGEGRRSAGGSWQVSELPDLDEVSGPARRIGTVDAIVNRGGRMCGYNTAYIGIQDLIRETGIDPAGKKILILGSGRDAETARAALADMGAGQILKVSMKEGEGAAGGGQVYQTCADAEIIINATSCGQSPRLEESPLSLEPFTRLSGLVDLIYDPLRTGLVLEAQKRGIPARGGLYMQVMKAVHAHELLTGTEIGRAVSGRIYQEVLNARRNIVLTGMSLAGKTTLGTLLSGQLGRRLEDTDQMIVQRQQREITDIFARDGEPYFRDLETAMCRELAVEKGIIIATGGGAILRQENVDALRKNGFIVFLDRPLDQLMPASDRPLADTREKVVALLEKRYPIYRSTCDGSIANDGTPEEGRDKILALLGFPCSREERPDATALRGRAMGCTHSGEDRPGAATPGGTAGAYPCKEDRI